MRLWSIHPSYLDPKGLVALWRETLLAQQVLLGRTRGYRHHPQLKRFRLSPNPVGAIAGYLRSVADEADRRMYRFDKSKIAPEKPEEKIPVTTGQVEYEFKHLLSKLQRRSPDFFSRACGEKTIRVHPLFFAVNGDIETWEAAR